MFINGKGGIFKSEKTSIKQLFGQGVISAGIRVIDRFLGEIESIRYCFLALYDVVNFVFNFFP